MRMSSRASSSSSLLGAIIFADACGGAVFEVSWARQERDSSRQQ